MPADPSTYNTRQPGPPGDHDPFRSARSPRAVRLRHVQIKYHTLRTDSHSFFLLFFSSSEIIFHLTTILVDPYSSLDLEALMSDVQKLQRMLLKPENYGDVYPRFMHARRSVRQCVHQAPAQSRIPDEACKT